MKDSRTPLIIIAALARNRVIGRNNTLPWRLPGDLRFFKKTTLGHAILMGRKTWESLGRPLPERLNLVLTHNRDFRADGAERVDSLETARMRAQQFAPDKPLFVIGGAEIFRQALPHAEKMILTEIDADIEGDTFFPPFERQDWQEIAREAGESDSHPDYAFVTYVRL